MMKIRKNNSIANNFRLIGNEHYKSLEFSKALLFYNKSLCYAIPSSIEYSLSFANRSAVYYETEEYEFCIENIELAINFGYPKDKIPKLMERHKKCKNLIEHYNTNLLKNPWNFFKLSHSPNLKIPYIVNCIKLQKSKKFGRHLITIERLKAGDVIAIEKPFYKYIMNSSRYSHCTNCLKSEKLNLFPCKKCNYTMFCSKECLSKGHRFHQFECDIDIDLEQDSCIFKKNHRVVFEALGIFGRISELQTFLEENPDKKTIFDFNFSCIKNSDTIDKNLTLAIHSLQKNPLPKELEPLMKEHCKLMTSITKNQKHKKFLDNFMRQQMKVIITNSFGLTENENEIGSGIFPFASYFNHSCAPNVGKITVNGHLVFIVLRPIEKNQQLFVCYRQNFFHCDLQERQDEILKSYGFVCTCEACEKNYPNIEKLPRYEKTLKISSKNLLSLPTIIEEYHENCDFINENSEFYPNYEICKLITRNHQLLNCLVCITTLCLKPLNIFYLLNESKLSKYDNKRSVNTSEK
ncbi:hypothetical protein PVAND_006745 [Polypedilum vanderplanki]|uniref:Uncharacterized protein n=1 Tax=Polypedilum vanderplanki TaxID=319348 RepID=A0A9J6C525_POLVA|nr:hypothetical protein PVAND_006745 [Polypedilum vanderplanki]